MKKFKRTKASRKDPPVKKRKLFSKQTIWAIGIILIMVLSVVGFMYVAPSQSEDEYNGIIFIPILASNGYVDHWVAQIADSPVRVYNHPLDIEFVNVSQDIVTTLSSSKVFYMTSDAEDQYKEDLALINYQFSTELVSTGVVFVPAFTMNNSFGKPIITCDNATANVPVIYFKSGRNNSITSQGNCVVVDFSSQMMLAKFRDRILLAILGVMS